MGRGSTGGEGIPARPEVTSYPNYVSDANVHGLIEALREAAERFYSESGHDAEVSTDFTEPYEGIEITVDGYEVVQLKVVPRPAQSRDGRHTSPEPQATFYPRVQSKLEKQVLELLAASPGGKASAKKIAGAVGAAVEPLKRSELARLVSERLIERNERGATGYEITALGREALASAPYLG